MDELILKRIAGLITANSGIRIRDQDHSSFAAKLWKRAKLRGITSLQDYHTLLVNELASRPSLEQSQVGLVGAATRRQSSELEWQALFTELTVNESYFFRDQNQFRLLANNILPDLIRRKQHQWEQRGGQGSSKPRLRIWSAGCSTGEELYSIAIVLNELNFPWTQWDTLLIGTDISLAALTTAQQGIYGGWSFRQIEAQIQQKYFHLHHQSLKIRADIRQRVTFQYSNLFTEIFPAPSHLLQEMDLILCRNVFIYFDQAAIAHILHKFHHTLTHQGCLMTGHTELYGQDIHPFQIKNYPESLVYQRRDLAADGTKVTLPSLTGAGSISSSSGQSTTAALIPHRPVAPVLVAPITADRPGSPADHPTVLATARDCLDQQNYPEAIRLVNQIATNHPHSFEAWTIAAQAYANIGNYDRAREFCTLALSRQPLSVDLHYLLAQIAEEENQMEQAKDYLRRVIYLEPSAVRAYLDLASIYRCENRPDQVEKMQRLALKTLQILPPNQILDKQTGITVFDLRQHLEKQLMV